MPQPNQEIPRLLPQWRREDCLFAVSKAMLRLRSERGWKIAALAEELECSTDTIISASNEDNLLSLDIAARLCTKFPEEAAELRSIFGMNGGASPTTEDRIALIERELSALRREVTA